MDKLPDWLGRGHLHRRNIAAALLLLLTVLHLVSHAAYGMEAQRTCRTAAAEAERRHGLPAGLLLAIGKVESGRPDRVTGGVEPWPWAVNADDQGLMFQTKTAAIAWVQSAQARGLASVDVGCFQINLFFHPADFATLEQAFDPAHNADAAARFLVSLHAALGDWGAATGAYHSRTRSLADPYRRRVAAAVEQLTAAQTDPMLLLKRAWEATLSPSLAGTPHATSIAYAVPLSPALLSFLPTRTTAPAVPATLRQMIWKGP